MAHRSTVQKLTDIINDGVNRLDSNDADDLLDLIHNAEHLIGSVSHQWRGNTRILDVEENLKTLTSVPGASRGT